jgi:hypothetical protein
VLAAARGGGETVGDELARLLLLLLAAALFVQVTRGTTRRWLRMKFVGRP